MAADWEEVKRLAADFQRAQLSSTVQRLSERNCIEIVKKLIELKLIDVIFTTDGKEYLTPQRLLKEIKDELIVHGGRINLVELSHNLSVDFSHIEGKASEFAKSEPDTRIVLGQLITSDYLDHLAEEVNEKLQQAGQVTIGELTKQYDLPGDFLQETVHERLGTIIQGHADQNDQRTFFTEAYISQHKYRIRGVLSALTRPVPVVNLISHFKFPERLFYNVAEELIKDGRISGSLSGGRSERTLYIPDMYAKSQNEWVDAFYKQNGYLEYDSLSRLGIQDPRSYINRRFKNEPFTFLSSGCVGKAILDQVEADIEEALNTGTWVDVMPLLPSVFNTDDCQQIIKAVVKSISKQGTVVHIYCDTMVISDAFLKMCLDTFNTLMNAKAEEDTVKNAHLFAVPQSMAKVPKKEDISKTKQDKKDERRKKATTGKAGGGSQGRETKTKSVKKKYHISKYEDSDSEEDTATLSFTKESKYPELEFLGVQEIKDNLLKTTLLQDCPKELVSELAEQMHRPLTKKYQDVARSVYEASIATSGSSRRKLHAELQEKFSSLLAHIYMFEKAIKLFPEETSTQLMKHILKTLCTDIANMSVNYLAGEHGVASDVDVSAFLSPEARQKLINKFPEDIRQKLMKMHNSLIAKTLEEFQNSIDIILGAGICDMIIRKADKKKERLVLSNHRQSLLAQLSDVNDPALCLHLSVLLLFQTQTHNMLHASGKFVPQIISYLQKQVPLEIYQLLAEYQEYVIRKLTATENEEQKHEAEIKLQELMPRVKEIAITYKKVSISEPES